MASLGWQVTRALFGVGERIAPRMAGHAAFELFARTPNPRRQTEGERRAVVKAAEFMRTARHHRLPLGQDCVVVHEFRPASGEELGRVLVIHGWRSRTEYMRSVIEGFRAAGWRVYSIDLPGHGQSSSRRLTMMKALRAVGAAAQWFGPFHAMVGHSFGGVVAVNAVAGALATVPPVETQRLLLIAAPNSISEVLDGFGRQVGLGGRSRDAMVARIERLARRRLDEFSGAYQLARLGLPTLVAHAPDDREVPADDARAYAAAGDHVSLHWSPGAGHRRILSDAGVISRIVSFATGRTAAIADC